MLSVASLTGHEEHGEVTIKKGGPGCRPFSIHRSNLPGEFDRHLNNSVAEFVARDPERFASVGDQLALLIKVKIQGRIA